MNAVPISTQERINNLYFLDKVLNIDNLKNIRQFYFKKRYVYIKFIFMKIIAIIKQYIYLKK